MAHAERLRILLRQLGERLWVKPLVFCVLSIAGVVVAKAAEKTNLHEMAPQLSAESLEALLSIMAAAMLVIATFALASMVSAYASASRTATPRSFPLVIADDVSQNALSTFVGAFIFSIVSLTALKNEVFLEAGRVALFLLTVAVFAMVILTFVHWADRIARLGRLGSTIEKVEAATEAAMKQRRAAPTLGGLAAEGGAPKGRAVHAPTVGYVQHVDINALQACAEEADAYVTVTALPGSFAAPGRALAYVRQDGDQEADVDCEKIASAFAIGRDRVFADDPRFGLVVLSEIGDKALSPGINDPGTAIAIIGSLVRLFALWRAPEEERPAPEFDRVQVPELSIRDMFDDAFTAIARDGAGSVEVVVRLMKALSSLASFGDPAMRDAAKDHARLALARAENEMDLADDLALVRKAAKFAHD